MSDTRMSAGDAGNNPSDEPVTAGADQSLAVEMTGISKSFFGEMAVSSVDFDVR